MSMPRALNTTRPRVSRPKIPRDLGPDPEGAMAARMPDPTPGSAAAGFLGFLLDPVSLAAAAAPAAEPPSVGDAAASEASGSTGSMYVSKSDEKATAAATQTTGVSVSIRRTMTPAK